MGGARRGQQIVDVPKRRRKGWMLLARRGQVQIATHAPSTTRGDGKVEIGHRRRLRRGVWLAWGSDRTWRCGSRRATWLGWPTPREWQIRPRDGRQIVGLRRGRSWRRLRLGLCGLRRNRRSLRQRGLPPCDRGKRSFGEVAEAHHRGFLHRGRRRSLRRRCGRWGSSAWLLNRKRVPAFRAPHLQALRRHAALVDLVRRVACLTLDPQHLGSAGYHAARRRG